MRQLQVITPEKTDVIHCDGKITPITATRILASYVEELGKLPTMRREKNIVIFDFTRKETLQ